ncbi:hypothetical protein [Campylobacter rectus]
MRGRPPTHPTAREKWRHCVQVKFSAVALQILNLCFQGAGLGK